MAGDWIPFYVSTPRKSEVLQIARETNRNRHEVIGLLMEFWAWCQGETRDRLLPRLTIGDVCVAVGGDEAFWRAVEVVGWVSFTDKGIEIPNADNWLSNGAKSRLSKAQRQKRWRENRAENVDVSVGAPPSTQASTRGEKRRGKKDKGESRVFVPPTPDALAIYAAEYSRQQQAKGKTWPKREFVADRFVDHYASNGWKVGKNKMKDWKAAVRNWGNRDFGDEGSQHQPSQYKDLTPPGGGLL